MLILLFRGIFLIGILSWYSTNVWKMIDGYFKDRFEKYLQREYEKNPKMRDDVDAYGTVVRNEKGTGEQRRQDVAGRTKEDTDQIHSEQRSCMTVATRGEETCRIDFSTMEASAGAETGSGSLISSTSSNSEDMIGGGHASESEVIGKGAVDKNAFAESSSTVSRASKSVEELPANDEGSLDSDKVAKSVLTVEAIIGNLEENVISTVETNSGTSEAATKERNAVGSAIGEVGKSVGKKPTKRKSTQRRFSRESIKSKTEEKEEEDKNKGKKKKKQKVKTIILTEEDFKEAKIKSGLKDYDFSEFDDDGLEGSDEQPEGILVSKLPFKPRADIGNLERVTDDEFCPLTLEDEVNCGETKTWP